MTYLTDIDRSKSRMKQRFPMAKHAAETWASHAASTQADEEIMGMTVKFLEKEATFQRHSNDT